jgi:hypothetical protein
MTIDNYFTLKANLIESGYADEIDWQTNLQPITDPIIFRNEAIWVILNSGMKAQIARLIHTRIWQAINDKRDISEVFGHKGKVKAIKFILENYTEMFNQYGFSFDKLEFLQSLPYIGKITKFHLAKNLGFDVVKPDRHLVRIASFYGFKDCNELCKWISSSSGDRVSVVDIVLWRSANLGWI